MKFCVLIFETVFASDVLVTLEYGNLNNLIFKTVTILDCSKSSCLFSNKNATRAANKICAVYGEDAVGERTVLKWFARFKAGNFNLQDQERQVKRSTTHEDFGYRGSKGPKHWAEGLHYGTCAGKLQSPIDIEDHKVKPVRLPPLVFKGFHSIPTSMVLTNNGHTVKLEIDTSTLATLSGGPLSGQYAFSHLHFHWGANDSVGSEDLINNHSFPMELHMVFYKLEYRNLDTALRYKDGLCVLAVFYDAYDFDNSVYSEIVEHLHAVTRPQLKKILRAPMTLDDLLPSNKHHYYTYNGSLTTPPCYEVVTWLDFKEPIPMSHFQIAEFRKLKSSEGELTENFRPTQPLGNRTVLYNVGERPVGRKSLREYDFHDSQNGSGVLFTATCMFLSILFLLIR